MNPLMIAALICVTSPTCEEVYSIASPDPAKGPMCMSNGDEVAYAVRRTKEWWTVSYTPHGISECPDNHDRRF